MKAHSNPHRHGFIGPRCTPLDSLPDEYGIPTFVDYHRACKAEGCMVRLTSETRAGAHLLCIEHGQEYEREKAARQRAKRAAPAIKAAATRATPEWIAMDKARREERKRAADGWNDVKERELRTGLQRAIPFVYRTIGLYKNAAHEQQVKQRLERDREMKALLLQAIPLIPTGPTSAIPVDTDDDPPRTAHGEFLAMCSTYAV